MNSMSQTRGGEKVCLSIYENNSYLSPARGHVAADHDLSDDHDRRRRNNR